ncbi:MAG: ABC transporter permease [Longimicrobiales bacterium]
MAILSHGLWQRKFGADAGIIGQSITVNGAARRVIGVLPSRFEGIGEMDAEIYGNNWRDEQDDFGSRYLRVFGRLKAGVSVGSARAEFAAIEERLEREQPRTNAGMMAVVTPLRDALVGETKQPMVLVSGASLLLLLIACANLSSILIARGYARMREFAIRSVLGASGGRAIHQLLTESLCL